MSITLTWDLVFLWVGRITCALLCLAPLIYGIGFISFSVSMSGWTFRGSWLGRKLRRRIPKTPTATRPPVQKEEDPHVER